MVRSTPNRASDINEHHTAEHAYQARVLALQEEDVPRGRVGVVQREEERAGAGQEDERRALRPDGEEESRRGARAGGPAAARER